MPRNGSGVYVAPSNNWNPAVAAAEASASDWNDTLDDLETAITGSIAADGQTVLSARINFAAGLSSFAGATTGVSYSFTGDPNTGIYSPASDKVGIVAGGTEVLRIESALLNPITNNTVDLGSGSVKFKDAYVAGVLTVGSISGAAASTTAAGVVELATDAEAQTGTDTARAITPANLQAVTGTETRKGVLELATDAEAQTGTDTARAITPANLQAVTATATRKGIVEQATAAEVIAETADKYPDSALLKHHPGVAKAWGSYKNLTSFSTYDTYNVTSIADTGTGVATVTIANDMSNTTYTIVVGGDRNDGGSESGHLSTRTRAAGSFIIRSFGNGAAANTLNDWDYISFAVYGTLA